MNDAEKKQTYETLLTEGLSQGRSAHMEDAIETFSRALTYQPLAGLAYRHRGHRYLSVRRFAEGAADLALAAELIPENWDVWYHLGLAYYLQGDDARALDAYRVCFEMTEASDENLVAIADWLYLTRRNLKDDAAAEVLAGVDAATEAGENIAYKNRILVYRGIWSVEDGFAWLNDPATDTINRLTFAYGFAHYLSDQGRTADAAEALSTLRTLGADESLRYAFAVLADEARNAQ